MSDYKRVLDHSRRLSRLIKLRCPEPILRTVLGLLVAEFVRTPGVDRDRVRNELEQMIAAIDRDQGQL